MVRRLAIVLLLAAVALSAGELVWQQSDFTAGADGWHEWTPRKETAARLFVDTKIGHRSPGSLAIAGNDNPAEIGGWEKAVGDIAPGSWYRLEACYRVTGTDYEPRQVIARLDWRTAAGKRAGEPEYAYLSETKDGWTTLRVEAPAPRGASSVLLQLLLWDAPKASLWWDDLSLSKIYAPRPRKVKIASINLKPRATGSTDASLAAFEEVVAKSVPEDVDVIVLPEGVTVVGTGKSYADVAEPVPGPVTARLGRLARSRSAYLVAGVYEREGPAVYNTAVLLDREGKLAGKYRKVYIPREETEGGISPGASYPVFETDFGKLGMMICWDIEYPDPARAMALQGAELLLVPIWGGSNILAQARALENHLFLATSGYDHPTRILDPDGEVLAIASEQGTAATATIDLNKRYADPWLGNMRARFHREVRLDIPRETPR